MILRHLRIYFRHKWSLKINTFCYSIRGESFMSKELHGKSSRNGTDIIDLCKSAWSAGIATRNQSNNITFEEQVDLSPTVLQSIINASFERNDYNTLTLTISEAAKLKKLPADILSNTITNTMLLKNRELTNTLILIAHQYNISLSENLYNEVLDSFISHFCWTLAQPILLQMIQNKMNIQNRATFFTLAGLFKDNDGTLLALNLITEIIKNRRDDVCEDFHFNRILKYTRSTSNQNTNYKSPMHKKVDTPIPLVCIKNVLNESLNSLRNPTSPWYHFSILKLLVTITTSYGYDDVANQYVRQVVETAVAQKIDLLPILRLFSHSLKASQNTPIISTLLQLSIQHVTLAKFNDGPFYAIDYLNMFWNLNYMNFIATNNPVNLSTSTTTTTAINNITSCQVLYNNILQFYQDPIRGQIVLSPAAGNDRRILRILCDELGLQHRPDSSSTSTYNKSTYDMLVWKSDKNHTHFNPPLPTFSEIIEKDALRNKFRKIYPMPTGWEIIHTNLIKYDAEILSNIVNTLLYSMLSYPSVIWTLNILEILHIKKIKLSQNLICALIYMCKGTSDIYGLLEVIDIAQRHGDSPLSKENWSRILEVANHIGQSEISITVYRENFMEIIKQMQIQKVDLDIHSLRPLLKIFLSSSTTSTSSVTSYSLSLQSLGMRNKILSKLYHQKQLEINTTECTALTLLLLKRYRSLNDIFRLASPIYKTENYLYVFPMAFTEVINKLHQKNTTEEELGINFLSQFDKDWKRIHSNEGRESLYDLLVATLSVSGKRNELIQNMTSEDTKMVLTTLTIYISYLIAVQKQDYRKAFDLLYITFSLFEEADKYQKNAELSDDAVNNRSNQDDVK